MNSEYFFKLFKATEKHNKNGYYFRFMDFIGVLRNLDLLEEEDNDI